MSSLLSLQNIALLGISFMGLSAIRMYQAYCQAVLGIDNHPGHRVILSIKSMLAQVLPRIPVLTIGETHLFRTKYESFKDAGSDVHSIVSCWPKPRVELMVADAALIKEITSVQTRFPKPLADYEPIKTFGRNIVASEGEEWKRHRKLSAPAFSDRNNVLVWEESVRIVTDMMDNIWLNKQEIEVDHCVDITLPMALQVIGAAGFGRKLAWEDDKVIPSGHQMSYQDALQGVANNLIFKLAVPGWVFALTKRLRKVKLAFKEFEIYMQEMIQHRRAQEGHLERHDLFTSLLNANNGENFSSGEVALPDSELLGNIFIFLLAGHETTAHTLCFCFGLLAIYQEEQERLHQHIRTIIPEGEKPTYEKMHLLKYSLAVFNETLRKYPSVTAIPKYSTQDTTFVTTNAKGEKITIPVPKGTIVTVHTPGLHHNPKYWEDPEAFKPSRFLGDWPREAFLPFSSGPRACIGRKFFETEALAILTMLVLRYRIEMKDEPKFANETPLQKEGRLLSAKDGLTLKPNKVPLIFKRR